MIERNEEQGTAEAGSACSAELGVIQRTKNAFDYSDPYLLGEDVVLLLVVAKKVHNALVDDGVHGPYVLGEDLWNDFDAAFKKA